MKPLLTVSLSYFSVATWAEQAPPSCLGNVKFDVISLNDALVGASIRQPQILIAQQELAKANATTLAATTPFLPSANISVQGEHFVSRSASGVISVGSTVVGGQGDRFSNYPSISATLNLFNGGKDIAGYRGAQSGVRASESELASQINDSFDTVLTTYNDLLKAQFALYQQSNAVELVEQLAKLSEERYQRGRDNLITVVQAKITLAQNERSLFQACQALSAKSAALAQAIGVRLPAEHILKLSDPLPDVATLQPGKEDIENAIQSDPAVTAAKELMDVAQKKLDQSRAAFYPTVSLVARYDWLGQSTNSFGDAYNSTSPNSYRVGIALQQSLGPFTSEYAAIESARADVIKAEASYQQSMIEVETKLRNALSAKLQADLSAQSAQKSARQAQEVVRLTDQLVSSGRTSLDMLEQAKIASGTEQEQANELAQDAKLNAWLAYRALKPIEFATVLIRASHEETLLHNIIPGVQSRASVPQLH